MFRALRRYDTSFLARLPKFISLISFSQNYKLHMTSLLSPTNRPYQRVKKPHSSFPVLFKPSFPYSPNLLHYSRCLFNPISYMCFLVSVSSYYGMYPKYLNSFTSSIFTFFHLPIYSLFLPPFFLNLIIFVLSTFNLNFFPSRYFSNPVIKPAIPFSSFATAAILSAYASVYIFSFSTLNPPHPFFLISSSISDINMISRK